MENPAMTTPEPGAEIILGIAQDASVFILTIVTQGGQRHQLMFPASTVIELHEQLGEIRRKYPAIRKDDAKA